MRLKMINEAEARAGYKSANAIVALSGWTPTPDALAIQERVIRGELTNDQAVEAHIAQVRASCENS
jgi:hypothetical protein